MHSRMWTHHIARAGGTKDSSDVCSSRGEHYPLPSARLPPAHSVAHLRRLHRPQWHLAKFQRQGLVTSSYETSVVSHYELRFYAVSQTASGYGYASALAQ